MCSLIIFDVSVETTFLELKLQVSEMGMKRMVRFSILEFDLLDGQAGEENTKQWDDDDKVLAALAARPGTDIFVEPKEREPVSAGEFFLCTTSSWTTTVFHAMFLASYTVLLRPH